MGFTCILSDGTNLCLNGGYCENNTCICPTGYTFDFTVLHAPNCGLHQDTFFYCKILFFPIWILTCLYLLKMLIETFTQNRQFEMARIMFFYHLSFGGIIVGMIVQEGNFEVQLFFVTIFYSFMLIFLNRILERMLIGLCVFMVPDQSFHKLFFLIRFWEKISILLFTCSGIASIFYCRTEFHDTVFMMYQTIVYICLDVTMIICFRGIRDFLDSIEDHHFNQLQDKIKSMRKMLLLWITALSCLGFSVVIIGSSLGSIPYQFYFIMVPGCIMTGFGPLALRASPFIKNTEVQGRHHMIPENSHRDDGSDVSQQAVVPRRGFFSIVAA